MKRENIKLISKNDNLELDCLLMSPEKDVKAVIQLAHGMNEHKERYIDFMKFLVKNGYACFINDHRGHGKSIKNDDDLGYFYDDKANYVVEDLYQITEYLRDRFKDKKIILMGHSMGSMIVRKYISKYDNKIDGLIVCGSPSKEGLAFVGLGVVKFLKIFYGDRHRSKFVKNLMFNGYNKGNDIDNGWICNNKKVVKLYNNDPLCIYDYTLNGYENIIRLMMDTYNKNIYSKKNLKLPIYFIAGYDDPVIKNELSFNKAQQFLKDIGYKNICSTIYKNKKHEILNELDNDIVYNDILNWITLLIR